MRPRFRHHLLMAAGVALLAIAAGALAFRDDRSVVTLVNRTGESLESLYLSYDHDREVIRLEPGQAYTGRYRRDPKGSGYFGVRLSIMANDGSRRTCFLPSVLTYGAPMNGWLSRTNRGYRLDADVSGHIDYNEPRLGFIPGWFPGGHSQRDAELAAGFLRR